MAMEGCEAAPVFAHSSNTADQQKVKIVGRARGSAMAGGAGLMVVLGCVPFGRWHGPRRDARLDLT